MWTWETGWIGEAYKKWSSSSTVSASHIEIVKKPESHHFSQRGEGALGIFLSSLSSKNMDRSFSPCSLLHGTLSHDLWPMNWLFNSSTRRQQKWNRRSSPVYLIWQRLMLWNRVTIHVVVHLLYRAPDIEFSQAIQGSRKKLRLQLLGPKRICRFPTEKIWGAPADLTLSSKSAASSSTPFFLFQLPLYLGCIVKGNLGVLRPPSPFSILFFILHRALHRARS